MKDPSGVIRAWIYSQLNGTITYNTVAVPVYSFAPKDAAMPYILIASQSGATELDASTKDSWITRQSFTIEIYSEHTGNNASYVPINTIGDSVVQKLRTRSAITISGYNVVSLILDSTLTDMMDFDTKIVGIKILNFTMLIEES